jgi:endonuclease/exonuclease/phosphatase family metal-dependent hydrolase
VTVEVVDEELVEEQAPRRRWGWRTRIVVAMVAAWLLFLVLDSLLAHGPWVWAFTDMLPPPAFLVVPVLLGALSFLATRPVRTWLLVTVVVQLVLGFGSSGVNPSALWNSEQPVPAGAVKVVSWNTMYWEQADDPERFYQFIKSFDADVYLLQEYMYSTDRDAVFDYVDYRDRVEREFPGYRMIVKNELVTLTRLPVVATPRIDAKQVLRVDVRAGDDVISTYNVHLPVHVFMANPFKSKTINDTRRRVGIRNAQLDTLVANVGANTRSSVIAGDFNHSRTQDDVDRMSTVATDALAQNQSLYPTSWNANWWLGMWRLDLAFTTRHASTVRYDFRDPQGMSDHSVQELMIAP